MKTFILISCCAEKLPYSAPAEQLYQSANFKRRLAYARLLNPDSIFVISALHHVVPLDKVLEPYNVCLKEFSVREKRDWAQICWEQLDKIADRKSDNFIIFAGKDYYEELIKGFCNYSIITNYGVGTDVNQAKQFSKKEDSNLNTIIEFLKESSKNYCDDCISKKTGITPRQQVNQICNKAKHIIGCDNNSICCECRKRKITRSILVNGVNGDSSNN